MVGDKLRGALILLAALAFIACADGTTTTTDDAGTTPGETTPGGGDDTIDIGPTFHADIRPMLDQYCMRCHTEGGQGGLSFEDPALVQTLASVMLDRIESREMPPPAADPNCRDYVGSEYMFVPRLKLHALASGSKREHLLAQSKNNLSSTYRFGLSCRMQT